MTPLKGGSSQWANCLTKIYNGVMVISQRYEVAEWTLRAFKLDLSRVNRD